jgi:hypothetical protein
MNMDFIHYVSWTTEFLPQDILKENRSWKLLAPSHKTYLPKSTLHNTTPMRQNTYHRSSTHQQHRTYRIRTTNRTTSKLYIRDVSDPETSPQTFLVRDYSHFTTRIDSARSNTNQDSAKFSRWRCNNRSMVWKIRGAVDCALYEWCLVPTLGYGWLPVCIVFMCDRYCDEKVWENGCRNWKCCKRGVRNAAVWFQLTDCLRLW